MNDVVIVSGTSSIKPGGTQVFVKEMFSQNHHLNPHDNNVTSGLGVLKVFIYILIIFITKCSCTIRLRACAYFYLFCYLNN